MKIKGFYILTRRSIARMIAVMATAFVVLCSAVTTKDEPLVNRIRSTSIALYALDGEIDGRSTRTVVPAVHYIEFKSVYLEAKRYNKEHENPEKTARRDASPFATCSDFQKIVSPLRDCSKPLVFKGFSFYSQ